jgi:hypothetical protein
VNEDGDVSDKIGQGYPHGLQAGNPDQRSIHSGFASCAHSSAIRNRGLKKHIMAQLSLHSSGHGHTARGPQAKV